MEEEVIEIKEVIENVKWNLMEYKYHDVQVINKVSASLIWKVHKRILEITLKQILINQAFIDKCTMMSSILIDADDNRVMRLKIHNKEFVNQGIKGKELDFLDLIDNHVDYYILSQLINKLKAHVKIDTQSYGICICIKI